MGDQCSDPFSMNYVGFQPNFRGGYQCTSMSPQDILKAKIFQMQQDLYRQLLAANSNPVRSAQYQRQGGSRNVELYKTALCDYWSTGVPCRFGNRCWFAHGPEELRIAQFVVPAGYPHANSPFDYAVRKEIQPSNSLNGFGTSLPGGGAFSKVVGYERKIKRLQSSAWPDSVAFPSEGTADSGFSTERRSSSNSLSSSEMSSISPPEWLESLDHGEESTYHSCNSSTENIWQDAPQQNETGYRMWSDSDKTLLGAKITPNGGDDAHEKKDSPSNAEICDLYRWCGFCTMEDSCPFVHCQR